MTQVQVTVPEQHIIIPSLDVNVPAQNVTIPIGVVTVSNVPVTVPAYTTMVDVPDPAPNPTPNPPQTTDPPGLPTGYKLVWADEFTGTAVDTTKWNVRNGYKEGGTREGYIKAANSVVSNGTLKIVGKREDSTTSSGVVCHYSTGTIDTKSKASWMYGYFVARCKSPVGHDKTGGLWPAFWMRPDPTAPTPSDGEIDIMEAIGFPKQGDTADRRKQYKSTVWGTYSPAQSKGQWTANFTDGTTMDDWHYYAVEWTKDFMAFSVDGKEFFRVTPTNPAWYAQMFNKKYYLWVNMQMGGDMPGPMQAATVLPANFEVDYVRVYQK